MNEPLRVLVVDDQPDIPELISSLVERYGHAVCAILDAAVIRANLG